MKRKFHKSLSSLIPFSNICRLKAEDSNFFFPHRLLIFASVVAGLSRKMMYANAEKSARSHDGMLHHNIFWYRCKYVISASVSYKQVKYKDKIIHSNILENFIRLQSYGLLSNDHLKSNTYGIYLNCLWFGLMATFKIKS